MTDSEDKPLLRRECDHCALRVEVTNMKGWVKSIDIKFWAVLILVLGDLLAKVIR